MNLKYKSILIFISILLVTNSYAQTASFSSDKSAGCSPLIIFFNGTTSTGNNLTYQWDFGNGNKINGADGKPGAAYYSPGIYDVILVVKDGTGKLSSPVTKQIVVYKNPTANFTVAGNTSGCAPLNVSFLDLTAIGSAPITSYLWDFGDGDNANIKNPSHDYKSENTYSVKLITTDANGCKNNISKDGLISISQPISVDFTSTIQSSCGNSLTTIFRDATDYKNYAALGFTYLWDFGDGGTSALRNPSHTFTGVGNYNVKLTVLSSALSCNSSKIKENFIKIGSPNSDFSFKSSTGCGGKSLSFELENGIPDSAIVSWDFGDGTIIIGLASADTYRKPQHTYLASGNYIVKTTISYPNLPGCIGNITKPITVGSFALNLDAVSFGACKVPFSTTFSSNAPSNLQNFYWTFGDGSISREPKPTHTYTTTGIYDVGLVVADDGGCNAQVIKKKMINVGIVKANLKTDGRDAKKKPMLFEGDTLEIAGGCTDVPVKLWDISSSPTPITSYTWDFGDGSQQITQSTPIISHIYGSEGYYSPTLKIVTDDGCESTFKCDSCVLRGVRPDAKIQRYNYPYSCCGYDFPLNNETPISTIDFLWWYVTTGDYAPGKKDVNGVISDIDFFKIPMDAAPDGDWGFVTNANLPRGCGEGPDVILYTFNKGCLDTDSMFKVQKAYPPVFSTLLLRKPCTNYLAAGTVLDLNDTTQFQGGFSIPADGNVDTLIYYNFLFLKSDSANCRVEVRDTLTNLEFGTVFTDTLCDGVTLLPKKSLRMDSLIAHKVFKTMTLPPCFAGKGPVKFGGESYAVDNLSPRKCKCRVGGDTTHYRNEPPLITVTDAPITGCVPLSGKFGIMSNVAFDDDMVRWNFSTGDTIQKKDTILTFTAIGKVNYSLSVIDTNGCKFDSLLVNDFDVIGTKTKFKLDKNAFCINQPSITGAIILTDSSTSSGRVISRTWNMGNNIIKTGNDSIVNNIYTYADIPISYLQKKGLLVTLKTIDNANCMGLDSHYVYLRNPLPKFTKDIVSGCLDTLTIRLDDNDSLGYGPLYGKVTVKDLKNGDKKEKNFNGKNYKPQFVLDNGLYSISIKIEGDSLGKCEAISKEDTLIINSQRLLANIKKIKKEFTCPPANVQLFDSSRLFNASPITEYKWKFIKYPSPGNKEDLVKSGKTNPAIIVTDTGYYGATLYIKDINGCEADFERDSLFLVSTLKGSFSIPSDTICVGNSINFNGTSPNADKFTWDFGDGLVAEGNNSDHIFYETGIRYPTLILSDATGTCNVPVRDSLFVKSKPPADIHADTAFCMGGILTLKSPQDPNYKYDWNTGATTPNIDIIKNGFYKLKVTDISIQCFAEDSMNLIVYPLPEVMINPLERVCVGDQISIDATVPANTIIRQWSKDFIVSSSNVDFVTTLNNDATVSLLVTDDKNCIGGDTLVFKTLPKPIIQLKPIILCKGESGTFNAKPQNQNYNGGTYSWYLDDKPLNTPNNSLLTVNKEGIYKVKFNIEKCESISNNSVTVNPLPDTSTNPQIVIFCNENAPASLDAGNFSKYLWLPSGNPQRYLVANEPGNYGVEIYNQFNCKSIDTIRAENRCGPRIYVPSAFTPDTKPNSEYNVFVFNIGEFEMTIFDRWGEVIYQTNDSTKPWDGYYNGLLMPSGVYPWLIKYSGNNPDYSEVTKLEGSVTLVR